jgi:CBS domain-containing protein
MPDSQYPPSETPSELIKLADEIAKGTPLQQHTLRELLGWYKYERRGRVIVARMRKDLERLELRTEPDLDYAYIDGLLAFTRAQRSGGSSSQSAGHQPHEPDATKSVSEDPTYRIGKLPSANARPVSVNPSATIAEAVTLMLLHDYSQLPVMQSERILRGIVTWQSIGTQHVLARSCTTVQDCLEQAPVIDGDASLFSAINAIVERGFVLVRDGQNVISGIVTTTDLSLQFRQLAEPFLLLGEIEKHLRRISDGKFTAEELQRVRDPSDAQREIRDLSDLTFGEHIRLLEEPQRWAALKLNIDRSTFVRLLNDVREIRNNVMHFDPDGTAPSELESLRKFVRLLGVLGE